MTEAQEPIILQPAPIGYAQPPTRAGRRGKGFLLAAASWYLPGLGQFVVGDRRSAALWFGGWLLLSVLVTVVSVIPALFICFIVAIPLHILFTFASALDAARRGPFSQQRLLKFAVLRYAVGALLFAASLSYGPKLVFRLLLMRWMFFVVMPYKAMQPTIEVGDRVVAHKHVKAFRRWDVVVFEPPIRPTAHWYARVVGMPGETVEVGFDGDVRINGAVVKRPPGVAPYTQLPTGYYQGVLNGTATSPMKLGPDEFYVLGDNTAVSVDSRVWEVAAPGHQLGALPRDHIVARVSGIFWPLSRYRRL